jgi:hypothetical protein
MRRLLASLVTAGLAIGFSGLQPAFAGSNTQTLTKSIGAGRLSPVKVTHPSATTSSKFVSRGFNTPRATPDIGNDRAAPKSTNIPYPAVPVISSAIQLTGAAKGVKGTNSYDQEVAHGAYSYDVEPPDQGLCAGNGWIIDPVNMAVRMYNEGTLAQSGTAMALEDIFGETYAFGFNGGDNQVEGDVRCYWDQDTSRWFMSQLVLDLSNGTTENPTGTDRGYFEVAVSSSSNPSTSEWAVYKFDVTDDGTSDGTHNTTPNRTAYGCPCFGDQPLLGADANGIFISTNEYSIYGSNSNGAMFYAFDKQAMAAFLPTTYQIFAPGTAMATPDGSCYTGSTNNATCWYSIEPAESPNAVYATGSSGTEYALSALQFTGYCDNRIAEWAATNTSSLSTEPALVLSETTITSEEYCFPQFNGAYYDFNSNQKAGPTPLYDVRFNNGAPHPGPVTSNDDRMLQTVYAGGSLYSSLNTAVAVNNYYLQTGLAWFKVTAASGTLAQQGYVGEANADVMFGALGVTNTGGAVLAFTLTGYGFYPSTAYVILGGTKTGGNVTPVIHVADMGQSPQDGFTEYQSWGSGGWRPRWGDYSAAVADGSSVYFAGEYIQSANCSDSAFNSDPTCGGTRGIYANWGTSVNKLTF